MGFRNDREEYFLFMFKFLKNMEPHCVMFIGAS